MRARAFTSVVAALLLTGAAAAGPASAALAAPAAAAQGCGSGGYGAPIPCGPGVDVRPRCEDGTPVLRYAATPSDGAGSVALTFVDPGGDDAVLADQPLTGAVPWPDGPAWVAGAVEVQVATATGARTSVVVERTPAQACERAEVLAAGADPAAAPAAAPRERAEVLAATGGTAGPLVLVAAGLVLAGAAGVLAARDRRTARAAAGRTHG